MKNSRNREHYINNADFLAALIEHKRKCIEAKELEKPEPKIPNYIGECFIMIAERLSRKPNFISYTFRDEMIADAIENCMMYFRNFNPEKSKNPFAYFTQIIYYAFLRRIIKEKKQLYVKYKATEQFGIIDASELFDSENEHNMPQIETYENISEYIEKFEQTMKKKKKPKGIEKFIAPDDEKDLENLAEELLQEIDKDENSSSK